eukprot:CAMPEP_0172601250 /NCGR_PEP_ID=MMETSP1068-20121228/21414_1 /TAXON_ID=35684 /ORGANISM="Pseudopedinella elastica, Strain CCMP716" /LENGTH=49 /DNA_ID= /DNA_START= /DNA_END= /DNA_ORIENTATION=
MGGTVQAIGTMGMAAAVRGGPATRRKAGQIAAGATSTHATKAATAATVA